MAKADYIETDMDPFSTETQRIVHSNLTPLGHSSRAFSIRSGNAARLALPNDFFDVVLQSTVFTSILDRSLQHAIAVEMLRVLKPDGFILWYDFRWNNPRNPDVRGIQAQEISELFSGVRGALASSHAGHTAWKTRRSFITPFTCCFRERRFIVHITLR